MIIIFIPGNKTESKLQPSRLRPKYGIYSTLLIFHH